MIRKEAADGRHGPPRQRRGSHGRHRGGAGPRSQIAAERGRERGSGPRHRPRSFAGSAQGRHQAGHDAFPVRHSGGILYKLLDTEADELCSAEGMKKSRPNRHKGWFA